MTSDASLKQPNWWFGCSGCCIYEHYLEGPSPIKLLYIMLLKLRVPFFFYLFLLNLLYFFSSLSASSSSSIWKFGNRVRLYVQATTVSRILEQLGQLLMVFNLSVFPSLSFQWPQGRLYRNTVMNFFQHFGCHFILNNRNKPSPLVLHPRGLESFR